MKDIQYPYSYEREYQRFVKNTFTSAARIAQSSIFPFIATWLASRQDEENPEEESSFAGELAALIAALLFISKVNATQKQILLDLAQSTSIFTASQLQTWIKRKYGVKIPYVQSGPKIADWIYIQSITIDGRIQQFATGVNQAVSNGVIANKTKADIVADVSKLSDKLIDGAAFVAGNGIGNLAADTSQQMLQDAGIQQYAWITQRDERVRPAHKARHGKIFDWKNPPDDGHPGQPYLCRCVAAPVIKEGQKLVAELTTSNAFDLTVYRKGVTGSQRPERDKAYAAILKSGKMTPDEIKQLSENPASANLIYQNIIMSGRSSAENLQKLRS